MSALTQEYAKLRKTRLGRNAMWMMLGQGVSVVMQAIYFAVLARLLGANEYGVFVGAFAFTSLAAQYSTLGSGTMLLRYVAGRREAFAVYWGNVVLLTVSVGGLMVVALTLTGYFVLNPASASLVIFAAIANCLCSQLSIETGRVFQTFERMGITAILNMLTNVVRTLAAVAMLIFLHRSNAYLWSIASMTVSLLAAAAAVTCVTVLVGKPRFLPIMFPKHAFEGFGHAIAGSTSSLYNDLDKTMLSHYGMNHANGVYTVAYRIIDIATIPILSIRDAAMPRFFERGRASVSAVAELARRLLKRTMLIGILVAAGSFLLAPLLPLVVGPAFKESVAALRWLALIPLFRSVHQIAGSALTGAGMQRYRTVSQLGAAGMNFAMNLYLIPKYGWLGAAWASLITDGALSVVNVLSLQSCVRRAHKKSLKSRTPASGMILGSQFPMETQKSSVVKTALIYKDELLPLSETFILNQASALRTYRARYVGVRRSKASLQLSDDPVLVFPSAADNSLARLRSVLYYRIGFAPAFHSALQRLKPTVLHAHFAHCGRNALPLSKYLEIPLVVTLHGEDVTIKRDYHRLYKNLWDAASIFLCVSESIRESALDAGFPIHKLRVLRNGITITTSSPSKKERGMILFVGRLVEKKGCIYLLRAMSKVITACPDAQLVLIGDGPLKENLRAEIERLKLPVKFLGGQPLEVVASYQRKASVLCVPSVTAENGDCEGIPTVVIEGIAAGAFVVGTYHGGIPEIIQDRRTGLLVKERETGALAEALVLALTDRELWSRCTHSARQTIEERCDLVKQTAALEALYDEVANVTTSKEHS